jgi:hypothetical protein
MARRVSASSSTRTSRDRKSNISHLMDGKRREEMEERIRRGIRGVGGVESSVDGCTPRCSAV